MKALPTWMLAVAAALVLTTSGDAMAARKAKHTHGAEATQQKSAGQRHKVKRTGGGESVKERDRRLMRECRGLPNAGACLGYAS